MSELSWWLTWNFAEQGEINFFEDDGGWTGHAFLGEFFPIWSTWRSEYVLPVL